MAKHYDFFLPLAGMEKAKHIDENPADVRASNKLAKLYDEILKTNPTKTHEEVHALNVFLTRLLFCYFAEDSDIFRDNIFTSSISSHTQEDGSDVALYLERLFDVFNTPYEKRDGALPNYLKDFPYVNGGLFKDKYPIPKFNTKSRNILVEIGTLDWSQINPDIFGSMIQAVVTPEHRSDMGLHYTSVPNIMKVIKPLFLDELHEEFENAKGNSKKLNLLHLKIQNLKIFDPACGSGNFLIIAYKELRKLEMLIFKEGGLLISPSIKLTQFYGIELDDFAHEVAILSLWLAEHQMNVLFKKEFGTVPPALPLQDGANIVHGNAIRADWEEVCPKNDGDEIYILGNPPYLGFRNWSDEQKKDMNYVFTNKSSVKKLDYIACWFYLGGKYIRQSNAEFSFVSTNSIVQGEQVALLWPFLLDEFNLEIKYAYEPFKWTNNAKGNAGVTVVIVGVSNKSNKTKFLYKNNIKSEVNNINAYLSSAKEFYVTQFTEPLSKLPKIDLGSAAYDGGHLILTKEEKNNFIETNQNASKFIKQFIGGADFLRGIERYCLWIEDNQIDEANNIPNIKKRIDLCREYRLSAGRDARKAADIPHKFYYKRYKDSASLMIPVTSSSRREYIPIGYLNNGAVVSNGLYVIYDAEANVFGILSSKMHVIWLKSVAGRMRTDIRYSSGACYNAFPFPDITEKQKEEITELVFNILDERENHSEKTLAQMYDPDKMPKGLKEAHHQLDLAIEKCYRNKPFENDEERLEYLFKLYEEMTSKDN